MEGPLMTAPKENHHRVLHATTKTDRVRPQRRTGCSVEIPLVRVSSPE